MKKAIVLFTLLIVLLIMNGAYGEDIETSRRLYAVSAPYLTITDEISFENLKCFWNGSCDKIDDGAEGIPTILISSEEEPFLVNVFGSLPDKRHVLSLTKTDLYSNSNLANRWMIIPFEDIEPRRKIILLDGADILSNRFDPDTWNG